MSNFYLINCRGHRIDLQSVETCFAEGVTGMGLGTASDYAHVGNAYIKESSTDEQKEISFSLKFVAGDIYQKFRSVRDLIMEGPEKLAFVYAPGVGLPGDFKEYWIDCDLSEFVRQQTSGQYLDYKVTLRAKGLWYEATESHMPMERIENQLRFDFKWPAVLSDKFDRFAHVDGSDVDIEFVLTIHGPVTNPKIKVLDQAGTAVHELTIPAVIQAGESYFYSSRDNRLFIGKGNAVTQGESILSDYEIGTDVFFKIPKTGGTISVQGIADDAFLTEFTAYRYFRVV